MMMYEKNLAHQIPLGSDLCVCVWYITSYHHKQKIMGEEGSLKRQYCHLHQLLP